MSSDKPPMAPLLNIRTEPVVPRADKRNREPEAAMQRCRGVAEYFLEKPVMTSKSSAARSGSDDRIATLRLKLQTALLIGGFHPQEIRAQLSELQILQSSVRSISPASVHTKAAAA